MHRTRHIEFHWNIPLKASIILSISLVVVIDISFYDVVVPIDVQQDDCTIRAYVGKPKKWYKFR